MRQYTAKFNPLTYEEMLLRSVRTVLGAAAGDLSPEPTYEELRVALCKAVTAPDGTPWRYGDHGLARAKDPSGVDVPYYMTQALNLLLSSRHLVWFVDGKSRNLTPVITDRNGLAFGAWGVRGTGKSAWKRAQSSVTGLSMAWIFGVGCVDRAGREWDPTEWVLVMVNWKMPPGTPWDHNPAFD